MGRDKKNKPKRPLKHLRDKPNYDANGSISRIEAENELISRIIEAEKELWSRVTEVENKLIELIKTVYFPDPSEINQELLRTESITLLDGYSNLESLLRTTRHPIILRVFSEDQKDATILANVAANPNTPHDVLNRLSQWGTTLESIIAKNPATSTVTLFSIHHYSDSNEARKDAGYQLGEREAVLEDEDGIFYFDPIYDD